VCLLLSGQAYGIFVQIDEKTNPDNFFTKTTPSTTSSVYTSTTAALTINSYRFAYWTLNGIRQHDATGRASNPVVFTPTADTTLIAVYMLAILDTDGDGLLDVYEQEFFGNLTQNGLSDGDADGFTVQLEMLFGYNTTVFDWISEGGLARRSSDTTNIRLDLGYYEVTAVSDPPGFVGPVSQYATGGTLVTLPTPIASGSGLNFVGWYASDGSRADSPVTKQPAVVGVSAASVFTAKYVSATLDTDADGLLDWFEWFSFSSLSSSAASDPDNDGISILLEQVLGYTPFISDVLCEGGVARRSSDLTDINLAGYFSLQIISNPAGLHAGSLTWGAPGSSVDTPNLLNTNVNGYRFTGWDVDGVRAVDSTGASASKATVLLNSNKVATAQFLLDTVDSDADMISDWLEAFYYAGSLSGNALSDAENDGFTFALETLLGFHPRVFNLVREGGVSRRSTDSVSAPYIILNWRPTITGQPAGLTVATGSSFSLTVVAASFATPTYQWRKSGVNISGGTSATLTVPSAALANTALYDVVVTDIYGTVSSAAAGVSVDGLPMVTISPAAQLAVNPGATATLTAMAVGTAPITYQWRKNSVAITGGTAAVYTLPSAQLVNAGSYDVVINNPTGSATSSATVLSINNEVVITGNPASQNVVTTASVSFSVTATGTGPLTYQWHKDGSDILGATTATYSKASVTPADAGLYDVSVTNVVGSVSSAAATLVVNSPVTILAQPVSLTKNAGVSAAFSVSATGTAPLSYQWYKGLTAISGATAEVYTISSPSGTDSGIYTVSVTNPVGSVSSAAATLVVNDPLTIVTQPVALTVTALGSAAFSVTATGTAPLTYQWRKNGANIAGATSASYTIASAVSGSAGSYDVVVTNPAGNVTSASAALTVNTPLAITTQPVSLIKTVGAAAAFSVVATGTAPITYQWRKDGTNITGAVSASHTIPATVSGDTASYDVVITNPSGTLTSAAATLTVNTPVAITTQPVTLTRNVGASAVFTVAATGTAPLTYQWRKGGVAIAGATSATYSIASTATGDTASYSVVVTNVVGSVTSSNATLTVNTPLTITSQPVGLTKNTGATASFSVTATGTAPITYQWRKDGVAIAGATASAYTTGSLLESNAGSYNVVLLNPAGSLTSDTALLKLETPPTLTTVPVNTSVIAGMSASLRVAATDAGPIVYQWRKDGVPIPGANSPTYAIATAQTNDAGTYDCAVTGTKGVVTTVPVVLSINKPTGPVITAPPAGAGLPIGSVHTMKVTVGASAGIVTYQWFKDNALITGATGSTYTISSLSAYSWGSYTVAVTNAVATVKSAAALVTIVGPPVIYSDPLSIVVPFGSVGTVSAKVLCVSSFTYHWKKNGVLIGAPVTVAGGAVPITMTYTISNATTDSEGLYCVSAYNTQGAVESHPAIVQLDIAFYSTRLVRAGRTFDLRKVVNNGVVDLQAKVPSNDILQALIRTSGPASIWWSWGPMSVGKFEPIPGATSGNMDFAAFGLNKKPGQFMLTVKVGALPAKSIKFLVTSWGPAIQTTTLPTGGLSIVTQPQPLTLNAGGAANFGVFVSGSPSVYSWYKINPAGVRTLVSGVSVPFLSLSPVQIPDGARYFVVCADLLGNTIESAAVQLTVLPKGE
jgi:Immunoglobulin I-set domain